MKTLCLLGVCILASAVCLQAQPQMVYDWVRASDEVVELDPMDYHAGRVYHPGSQGGNMHVIIHAKQPITLAMAGAHEWNEALGHPEAYLHLDYRCIREHVVDTTYECHLPGDRPMVLVLHDERTADRAIFQGIGAIVHKAGGKALVSPNEVLITYHSWNCVQNCIQPEYQWKLLAKEKYELASSPKLYSVLTPDYDGQRLWVKIKAQMPMTIAVLPAKAADEVYDKPETLSAALAQTTCKQRGIQQMEFECKVSRADGPQSLIALPDSPVHSKKKVEIEFQTLKCTANCEMIPSDSDNK